MYILDVYAPSCLMKNNCEFLEIHPEHFKLYRYVYVHPILNPIFYHFVKIHIHLVIHLFTLYHMKRNHEVLLNLETTAR